MYVRHFMFLSKIYCICIGWWGILQTYNNKLIIYHNAHTTHPNAFTMHHNILQTYNNKLPRKMINSRYPTIYKQHTPINWYCTPVHKKHLNYTSLYWLYSDKSEASHHPNIGLHLLQSPILIIMHCPLYVPSWYVTSC